MTAMLATGKLMSVKEEQALVLRERDLYKIDAEDWTLHRPIEVETHLKETLVAKKEIKFVVYDGELMGGLRLTLAQGVDPATVEARGAVAVRRRGAEAVSCLSEEPWVKLEEYGQDSEGRARIRVCIYLGAEKDFLKERLVDGQLLVEVDLEVAVRREQLDKARDRLETLAKQIGGVSGHEDYKLVCGEEEFPCHRAILAARSPVVARGLAQGEHLGRAVREGWQVHDSSPAAVRALLDFVYTAQVPDMEEEGLAVEVHKLSDFFEVMELKDAAKEEIIRWISWVVLNLHLSLQAAVHLQRPEDPGGGGPLRAGRPGRHQGRRQQVHQCAREGGDGERGLEGQRQGPSQADGGDPGGLGGAHGGALRVSRGAALYLCLLDLSSFIS